MNYKKIAIIGKSATGKSTLSEKIACKTGLPLFHVDDYIWPAKLEVVAENEYLLKFENIMKTKKWIMEGYINKKMQNRLELADAVVYLDYSAHICLIRYLKRWLKHRVQNRQEIKNDPLEKFSIKLLYLEITRALFKSQRREIETVIKNIDPQKIIRIKSPKILDHFLSEQFSISELPVESPNSLVFGGN